MKTTIQEIKKEHQDRMKIHQPRWQRIVLLGVLGYEAAGCLVGASLLIAAPDGSLMDMPVTIMNGFFPDFLIPGIILFGLGILNTLSFRSVLRMTHIDWVMAGLGLGGLSVWFVVEIAILQELHWLHFMWGFPVLLGLVVTIPLVVLRNDSITMRKALLACGILSSLWYLGINIYVPLQYEGYSMLSQAVSELSAIGAPTRVLWDLVVMLYPLLFAAFGWGVWQSATGNRPLRIAGALIIVYCLLNFYWPPMHQREVIATGGGTLTDSLHIVWTLMTLIFMTMLMAFGAAAIRKKFGLYTIATFVVFLVFGVLTFMESAGMEANRPTPWMGLWERINISAFMLWVIVFAIILLRGYGASNSRKSTLPFEKKTNISKHGLSQSGRGVI